MGRQAKTAGPRAHASSKMGLLGSTTTSSTASCCQPETSSSAGLLLCVSFLFRTTFARLGKHDVLRAPITRSNASRTASGARDTGSGDGRAPVGNEERQFTGNQPVSECALQNLVIISLFTTCWAAGASTCVTTRKHGTDRECSRCFFSIGRTCNASRRSAVSNESLSQASTNTKKQRNWERSAAAGETGAVRALPVRRVSSGNSQNVTSARHGFASPSWAVSTGPANHETPLLSAAAVVEPVSRALSDAGFPAAATSWNLDKSEVFPVPTAPRAATGMETVGSILFSVDFLVGNR